MTVSYTHLDVYKRQRATVKALGLKKTNSQVVKEVTPQIEGMLHKVRHLVKVEEV